MPKQVSDNQDAGYIGENEFRSWATKIGWYPTKFDPDHGLDFVCQIRGDRTGKKSSEMHGKTLNVSVRSTTENSDTVTIDRSDAQLLLSTNSPTVLAIVRRAPHGRSGQVAIKFVDEQFVKELDIFLRGTTGSHTVHFSGAITNREEIQHNVAKLFQQPHMTMIARLLAECRLNGHLEEPRAEILHTAYGTFAYVHSKHPSVQTEVSQRVDVTDALRDVGMEVVLTPTSLMPSRCVGPTGARGDIDSLTPDEHCYPPRPETAADSGRTLDILRAMGQIRHELSRWNYDSALALAERLEQAMQNGRAATDPIMPEASFLLARVHVIRAEVQDTRAEDHIEHAKSLLAQIGTEPSALANAEVAADIEALMGAIENLERGPDAALERLAGCTAPYAIRIRLAMLLNKQDLDGAVALVEDMPPNLQWCELATTAYALKGRRQEAEGLVAWAAAQQDPAKYPQCVVRLAGAQLGRSLAGQEEGKTIQPHSLSEEERNDVRTALETLRPVLDPIVATGLIDSELGTAAVKIACDANHLLGKREDVAELTRLMYARRPVPIEVARSVVSGYMEPPPDLPDRLGEDHPSHFDANILAVVVQSSCMSQHEAALAKARELVPLADTDDKKEELFKLVLQIWQELEGDAVSQCEQVAVLLTSGNPKLCAVLDASRALRTGDPDAAIRALEREKADDDICWLQLRANAHLQKREVGSAIDLFVIAATKTGDPALLHKTGDLAFQEGKISIAASCYERLVEAQPDNVVARGNLASIYTFHVHDVGKAAAQFRALHEIEPKNPIHTVNLAICLAQLYRPQESLALYNDACDQDRPDIRAVLGRMELLLSLADPDAALASLQGLRHAFWNNQNFLLGFMNAAYAAGDEEAAHEALKALEGLRQAGGVDPNAFRQVPADEGLEMLKKGIEDARSRAERLHSEMLNGRMPWVWAEQVSGNAIYWGWRTRTHEMAWVGDDPVNRASFCIYATNGFHPRVSERNRRELLPIACPPEDTPVVADISSLITLHRLELLDVAADYFGEIVVPEGYLPTVLTDSRKMVLRQRSRQQTAEQLTKKTDSGIISILGEQTLRDADMATVDEYGESDEHCYHLIDLVRPVHDAGTISDGAYARISNVCAKRSSVDDAHPELTRLQDVVVDLSTLETATRFGLLDAIGGYYKIHITQETRTEMRNRLEAIQYQEETLKWHFDLWDLLRDDPRIRFASHTVPEGLKEEDSDPGQCLGFQGAALALETGMPLLADDRVWQALTLNERPEATRVAFGTDALIIALMDTGKVDISKATGAMRQLMAWRYRFVLPCAEVLKTLAEEYRTNPPGQALREVAEYVHDCMRDAGLFGGAEETERGESMAVRLYVSWLSVAAEFLIRLWEDDSFSEESARLLTEWTGQELLPSPPVVLHGDIRAKISSLASRILLSHALTSSSTLTSDERIPDAIKALKDALKLDDDEYLRIVTEILNGTRRRDTSPQ